MKEKNPVAFMSYFRFDDQHDEGRLSEFRERLSEEVRMQTGEDFPIFQDRNIEWGQNWKERIEGALKEVTFLIPIITPGFFKSPACRGELEKFIRYEKKLERNDLILSVYYVGCPLLNEEEKRNKDELAKVIASRQYADWRELRFEPFTSPQVGKTLAQLAIQIRKAIERQAGERAKKKLEAEKGPEKAARPARPRQEKTSEAELKSGQDSAFDPGISLEAASPRPSAKTEPPTHVVDPWHRGDFVSISQAIQTAQPGDRIIVRPGLYEEGLIMDKPLEIIGEGECSEIVIQAIGKEVILFKTTMGRVSNLTLKQIGGGNYFGIDITQGRLELEGCDITSQSLAGVAIHGGADPRLRRNRIHDGKQGAVFVYDNGQGTLEDNEIFGNARSGVIIKAGGNPTLRRNRIHDGKSSGVYVIDNGQGTLEDNEIFGNALAGVAITTGGNPTLRRNRIHDGKEGGVFVYENGQGTLEDNEIFGNALSGVKISEGGNLILRSNRIKNNGMVAVSIIKKSGGTIEDNDLRENGKGAWSISEDSQPLVKRARNLE